MPYTDRDSVPFCESRTESRIQAIFTQRKRAANFHEKMILQTNYFFTRFSQIHTMVPSPLPLWHDLCPLHGSSDEGLLKR